ARHGPAGRARGRPPRGPALHRPDGTGYRARTAGGVRRGGPALAVLRRRSELAEGVVPDPEGRDLQLGEAAQGRLHHRSRAGGEEVVLLPGAVPADHAGDVALLAGEARVAAARRDDPPPRV